MACSLSPVSAFLPLVEKRMMVSRLFTSACIISAVIVACPLAALAQPGTQPTKAARSVHLGYPAPDANLFYNEVTVEQSVGGSYFMVAGFSHGYFGMQEMKPGEGRVLFSVWDTAKGNDPTAVSPEDRVEVLFQDPDVTVKRFGGEGTGGQSFFPYSWRLGTPYKFLVEVTVTGDKTAYAGYFYLPESRSWKHLATFRITTGGEYLKGLYSFVEDFRRDVNSASEIRRAQFGNGWVRDLDGQWQPLLKGKFTASGAAWEAKDTIDAAVNRGQFYLQTGGETRTTHPLTSVIERPLGKGKPPAALPLAKKSPLRKIMTKVYSLADIFTPLIHPARAIMRTLIALLLLTSTSLAADPKVDRDLAYAEPKNKRQTVDIYAPAEGQDHPIVFWIHGGGWEAGDKAEVQKQAARRLTIRAWSSFRSIIACCRKPRSSRWPSDVAKAIRWTCDRAKEYGGDPHTILVMGHSAGAQLAALVCTDDAYLKAEGLSLSIVKGCVPVDGDTYDVPLQIATEPPKPSASHSKKFGSLESQTALSPVTHIGKGKSIPPFLILHVAGQPGTTNQAKRLFQVLQESSVPAKVYSAEGKTHGTINSELGLPDDKVTQATWVFLDEVLKK